MMLILFRFSLLSAVFFLAYYSIAYRTGGVAPSDFIDNTPLVEPQHWQSSHPDKLVRLSRQALEEDDTQKAEALLLEAFHYNITSGRVSAQLLEIYHQREQWEKADEVAAITHSLWPTHTQVRSRLANYWLGRERFEFLLSEWNVLLTQTPSLRKQLFPILQKIMEQPESFPALIPYIHNPPKWWDSFFRHVLNSSEDLPALQRLYQARTQSDIPLSTYERRAFVGHLSKKGLRNEAYFAWLSGLEPDELVLSGFIYDGGFEGKLSKTGFDWHYRQPKGVSIRATTTSGLTGRRGLYLQLNNRNLNFHHIWQPLNLRTGQYTFSIRYRVDRMNSDDTKGLSWRVRCLDKKRTILGESNAILTRSPWSTLSFSFSITPNCPAQLLRLESTSPYRHHRKLQGNLWFDDAMISRKLN